MVQKTHTRKKLKGRETRKNKKKEQLFCLKKNKIKRKKNKV